MKGVCQWVKYLNLDWSWVMNGIKLKFICLDKMNNKHSPFGRYSVIGVQLTKMF